MTIRVADPDDLSACFQLRGQTRQNALSVGELAAKGITIHSWRRAMLSGALAGFVCEAHAAIIGFCFVDTSAAEVLVLALSPAFEGRGIGHRLLAQAVDHLRSMGHRRLVLACATDPAMRSHGFYRHLGWTPTGEVDGAGDELLELT